MSVGGRVNTSDSSPSLLFLRTTGDLEPLYESGAKDIYVPQFVRIRLARSDDVGGGQTSPSK